MSPSEEPTTNANANANANATLRVVENATNILIMSDAGKLIFSRYGDETNLCTICGLIQTLRATTLNDPNLGYGDIQCINTSSSKIVFMAVGAITLVAISYKHNGPNGHNGGQQCDTEDYLHRQLECVYSTIIFTLTDEVQYMLQNDPNLDISYLLGSTNYKLKRLIDEMTLAEHSSKSCCWIGGVDVISPIPVEVSVRISSVLDAP